MIVDVKVTSLSCRELVSKKGNVYYKAEFFSKEYGVLKSFVKPELVPLIRLNKEQILNYQLDKDMQDNLSIKLVNIDSKYQSKQQVSQTESDEDLPFSEEENLQLYQGQQ